MADPDQVNPYAPSAVASDLSASFARARPTGRISAARIVLSTLGGIALSGALFGLTAATFISLFGGGRPQDFFPLLGIGMVVGAIVAAVFGLPTVLVTFCLSAPLVPRSKGWSALQAQSFAAVCGSCSGFLSVATMGSFEAESLLLASLPAAFGCAVTTFLVHHLCCPRKPSAGQ